MSNIEPTTGPTTGPTPWIKATRSNGDGACVQMRRNGDLIEVRDSKLGDDSPVLSFTSPEIVAWLDGAKNGEFEHLIRQAASA